MRRAGHLQEAEGGGAQEVQVLTGALQRHAVAQAVHQQRAHLRAGRQYDLVARRACMQPWPPSMYAASLQSARL